MLSNLLAILFPTFGVIGVGWIARRTGVQSKSAVMGLTNYVYYIALPAFIFQSIVTSDIGERFNLLDGQFLIGVLAAHLLVMAGVLLVFLALKKVKAGTRAVFPMLVTFGSTAYFGIPFATYAFGAEGAVYASLLSVVLVTALLFVNIFYLRKFSKIQLKRHVLKNLLELPFLWAVLAGLLWPLLHLPPLPLFLYRFIDMIGAGAVPVALLALGAYIYDFDLNKIPWAQAAFAAFVKVVAPSVLTFFVLRWLGVEGLRLAIGTALAATPTAITCFVLSEEYKVGERLTAGTILLSVFFSLAALAFISYLWIGTRVFL